MEASGYGSIFLTAVLAATILPLSSEAVLVALTVSGGYELWMLIALASVGNTVGAAINWAIGRYCLRWLDRIWFPVSPATLKKASVWFTRYGHYTLLFAWLPLVGDPLTVAAGLMRLCFSRFLLFVATGKTIRYIVVGLTTQELLT